MVREVGVLFDVHLEQPGGVLTGLQVLEGAGHLLGGGDVLGDLGRQLSHGVFSFLCVGCVVLYSVLRVLRSGLQFVFLFGDLFI